MKRFKTELEFLGNYWEEAKNIAYDILHNLPNCTENSKGLKFINKESVIKMFLVNYSEIGNSWSVEDILRKVSGKSKNLEVLADKIFYMVHKGRSNDVKPMIEKICTGRIKSLYKGCSKAQIKSNELRNSDDIRKRLGSTNYMRENLGKGHIRWNNQAYVLNELELNHLKTYFKI